MQQRGTEISSCVSCNQSFTAPLQVPIGRPQLQMQERQEDRHELGSAPNGHSYSPARSGSQRALDLFSNIATEAGTSLPAYPSLPAISTAAPEQPFPETPRGAALTELDVPKWPVSRKYCSLHSYRNIKLAELLTSSISKHLGLLQGPREINLQV